MNNSSIQRCIYSESALDCSPNFTIVRRLSNLFKSIEKIRPYGPYHIYVYRLKGLKIAWSTDLKWKIHIQSIWFIVGCFVNIKSNVANNSTSNSSSASFYFDCSHNGLPKIKIWILKIIFKLIIGENLFDRVWQGQQQSLTSCLYCIIEEIGLQNVHVDQWLVWSSLEKFHTFDIEQVDPVESKFWKCHFSSIIQ